MTHPVDLHVGQKVRGQRRLMGLTQQHLAKAIGIKFQQIQKYETGMNRISASKLWDISRVLQVPVEHFFDGYASEQGAQEKDENEIDMRELTKVVKIYRNLPVTQRKKLFQLAQTLIE